MGSTGLSPSLDGSCGAKLPGVRYKGVVAGRNFLPSKGYSRCGQHRARSIMLAGGARSGNAPPAAIRGELAEPVVLEMLSDAEVMLRVAAGDDAAFDYLVEKYRRPMISFMYRMTHNQAVAEELAQEVFLRVYRSRQSYAASAKFTTWLYRIATNLAVNHARDTKHERPENMVNIDEPDAETGYDGGCCR